MPTYARSRYFRCHPFIYLFFQPVLSVRRLCMGRPLIGGLYVHVSFQRPTDRLLLLLSLFVIQRTYVCLCRKIAQHSEWHRRKRGTVGLPTIFF